MVTGGATGIGRAAAERLNADGFRVIIGQPDAAAYDVPGCELRELDVRDEPGVAELMDDCGDDLAVLVNNAALVGLPVQASLLDHSTELFREILEVNLVGAFVASREAARVMIGGGRSGRIINLGSVNSFMAEEYASGYVSSKSGILGLTRACAVELAAHQITVNAVAPGQIWSESARAATPGAAGVPEYRFYREAPLGAGGEPTDVAAVISWLASGDSRWVTGTTIAVDGGFLAT